MKKIIIWLLISTLSLIVVMTSLYYINQKDPEKIRFIKKIIPNKVKFLVKSKIFFIPEYINKTKTLEENLINRIKINNRLESKLIKLMREKNLVNNEFFPQTQFLNLNYKEVPVENLEKTRSRYMNHNDKISTFFIETNDDNIFLVSEKGKTYFYETNDVLRNMEPKQSLAINNLPQNITVTDAMIFNNEIFIAFVNHDFSCESMEIFKATLNKNYLNFNEFYKQGSEGACKQTNPLGGRIAVFNDNGNESILVTLKDPDSKNYFILDQHNENLEYKFCIVLLIDMKTRKTRILSAGHRNPQGLFVNKKNTILLTEHGPRGGDEINKIIEGKNYGWPLASYGENYKDNYNFNDIYKFKKNHKKFGLEEPIYSFVPSIGISQIIESPKKFSKRWTNSYLVTSLKGSSIYRVIFNENFDKIITMEKIKVGKRIRDIVYNKKYNFFLLALEDGDGNIGVLSIDR